MNNKELLSEFKEKFEILKHELGFKSSLEELDEIFFIKNNVLKERFVSDSLSRQICSRIVELYMGWTNYLHSLVMPNPQNILNISEAKLFDQEEKKEMNQIMQKAMEMSSRSSVIGLAGDKAEEAKFIDDSVKLWESEFKPTLLKILRKVREEWEK